MGNALCCQNDLDEVPEDMHGGIPNGGTGAHKHTHTHPNQVRIPNQATTGDTVVHEENSSLSTRANSLISTQKSKRSHLEPSSHSSSPSSSPAPDFSSSQSTLPATTSPLDPIHHHHHHHHLQHIYKQVTGEKSFGATHPAKKTGQRPSNGVQTHSDTSSSNPRHKEHRKTTLSKTQKKYQSNNDRRFTADGGTSFNSQTLFSIERKMERDNISPDFQWLDGRRYHNTPGASYLLPNDIDEYVVHLHTCPFCFCLVLCLHWQRMMKLLS